MSCQFVFITLSATALGACQGVPSELALPLELRGSELRVTGATEPAAAIDMSRLEAWAFDGSLAVELSVELTQTGARVDRLAPGPVYLRHRGAWIVTERTALDLSRVTLGRENIVSTSSPTSLGLVLADLEPWSAGDQLQLYSRDVGLWWLGSPGPVAKGSTALELELAYEGPLASVGDEIWVSQLETRTLAEDPYQALSRAAAVRDVELDSSDPAVVAALIASPARSFEVDWRIGRFDELRLADQAVITNSWYDANLAVLDRASDHGFYGVAADLLTMRLTDQVGRRIDGQFAYSNPFPATWQTMATFIAWYPVAVRARAQDVPTTLFDSSWIRDRSEHLDGQRIEPAISAPVRLQVEAGSAPTATWSAPELGTAALYELTVFSLRSADSRTEVISQVQIRTELSRLRLPPGAVDPAADSFVVRVAAISAPESVAGAPGTRALPYAFASITSAATEP